MPLKLVAPRKGKSPNFTIRGSYLGVAVNKSSGTDKRSVARAILAKLERAIEAGEYPPKQVAAGDSERTFLKAAVEYMEAGRRPRYVARLIKHFGATPLANIDQAAIDAAAIELFPACNTRHPQCLRLHSGVGNSAPRRCRYKASAAERSQGSRRDRMAASRGCPRILSKPRTI